MKNAHLSNELVALVADYSKGKNIRKQLDLCIDLARSIEMELAVHRLGEAGKTARKAMEHEAGKVLSACVLEQANNVIRPDFQGRQK